MQARSRFFKGVPGARIFYRGKKYFMQESFAGGGSVFYFGQITVFRFFSHASATTSESFFKNTEISSLDFLLVHIMGIR